MNLSQAVQLGVVAILILVLALVVMALWLGRVQARLHRIHRQLDDLFGDDPDAGTAQRLAECLATGRMTAAAVQQLQTQQAGVAALLPSTIQHVGLVRFSPFHDTGGDQSFALALLDGRGDGVVVTGLHSRTDSRLYAKPVERHASEYSLTPEEREAISRALGAVAAES